MFQGAMTRLGRGQAPITVHVPSTGGRTIILDVVRSSRPGFNHMDATAVLVEGLYFPSCAVTGAEVNCQGLAFLETCGEAHT